MSTLSDFVRWARDKVIERPEIADYDLAVIIDDGRNRARVEEFEVDHMAREVILYTPALALDDDEYNYDLEPADDFED